MRARNLVGILVFTALVSCGGSGARRAPLTAAPEARSGPVEALVDIAFEAHALESPLERGTYHQSEPFRAQQHRAHRTDAVAARFHEQLSIIAEGLELERCVWAAERLAEAETPSLDAPPPADPPALYGTDPGPPTTANLVSALAAEMLAGLGSRDAACAYARVSAARAWRPVLARIERRDGQAALDAEDPRRAQVVRLREIDGPELESASRPEGRERLDALQSEAVAILETWDPPPPGLAALRDYDLRHPVPVAHPDGGTALRQLSALLRWAIRGGVAVAMPPVRNASPESRLLRGYLEALHRDPATALRLANSVPADLMEIEHDPSPSVAHQRRPGWLETSCETEPLGPQEDEIEAEPTGIDALYDEEEEEPQVYWCSAHYTARGLGQLAERRDEARPPGADFEDPYYGPLSERDRSPPRGTLSLYLFERACEAGDRISCARLGWALADGPEPQRDEARARGVLERGCAEGEGSGEACWRLGTLLRGTRGGPPDLERAWALFSSVCSRRLVDACTSQIEILRRDSRGLTAAQVLEFAEHHCELGSGLACTEAGVRQLATTPGEEAVRPALDHFVNACNVHGVDEACGRLTAIAIHHPEWAHLAAIYGSRFCSSSDRESHAGLCGWGALQSQDHDRIQLAERGCEAGLPDACAAAAIIASGPDERRVLEESCEAGSSLACMTIGERARRRDPARARALLRRACEDTDGLAMGCAELAELLASRRGGRPDPEGAATARRHACDVGRHPGTCTAE